MDRNSTSSEPEGRLGTHMDKGKWRWKVEETPDSVNFW